MELESHEKASTVQIVSQRKEKKERFLDFLGAAPSKDFWRHRFAGSDAFLKRVATLRASSVSHAAGILRRTPAFARTVDWRAVWAKCVAWAKRPTNAALLIWLAFVAGGVAFVFLLMTGALNSAVPEASRRKRWTEVANQVLNALFTIMCVYQHPRLCHHLALLLRWRFPHDVAHLRAVYCKNVSAGEAGDGVRNERLHVAFVVALLHATCLAQYAYCALFWFFDSDARPDWAVNLCMAFGLAAPVAAALYMVYGPLGRARKAVVVVLPGSASTASDEEDDDGCKSNNRNSRVVAVAAPEWAGGLFDVADDPTVAALSVTCTFCVFGWNMERLGMGNMYVHVFTFALLCAAPVLVFAVAALNVHDATLGFLVGATGALISVLGLLYGGYWRAQMRNRFGLPADRSICGGRPAMADYGKWLVCAPCALAQEVRTANLYDVEDGRLYLRGEDVSVSPEEETPAAMAPLQREGCVAPLITADKVDAPPPVVVPVVIVEMNR